MFNRNVITCRIILNRGYNSCDSSPPLKSTKNISDLLIFFYLPKTNLISIIVSLTHDTSIKTCFFQLQETNGVNN